MLVGMRLESVSLIDKFTIYLSFGGQSAILSADPQFSRAHLSSLRRKPDTSSSSFISISQRSLIGHKVIAVTQIGFDRVLMIEFDNRYQLISTLFGPNSNIFLMHSDEVIGKLRNRTQRWPLESQRFTDLSDAIFQKNGLSPLLKQLVSRIDIVQAFETGPPVLYPGGAYPFPISGFDNGKRMSTLSIAVEQCALRGNRIRQEIEERNSLRGVLIAAKKKILRLQSDLQKAIEAGDDALVNQMKGELLLSNMAHIQPKGNSFQCSDYSGNSMTIELDPTKSVVDNANAYFRKAKKQKSGKIAATKQMPLANQKLIEVEHLLTSIDLEDVDTVRKASSQFIREQSKASRPADEKPFDGKKIRTLEAPGGWTVLFGDNAEANDYLATRVAKPNDYWFHIRAGTGSHVVLQTHNQPSRVQPEAIRFAATIAARNSGQKHAKHVPVDYVLAKYVRKPRKSAPGLVTYMSEKTIFVDP